MKIVWSTQSKNRVSVFWFTLEWHHSNDIAEYLADNNIAVRSWKHCAQPLFKAYWEPHSVRASLYIYNTTEEIDTLFKVLETLK
jgi:cysteine desulfurase/selenocysteine lyase